MRVNVTGVALLAALLAACQPVPKAPTSAARSSPPPPRLALRVADGYDVSPGVAPLPPDAAVAVGPGEVLAATNGRISLLDRTGRQLAGGTPRDLFGALLRPDELQTDPRAVFDQDSGRFFLVMTAYPIGTVGSRVPPCPSDVPCRTGTLLAVSVTAQPEDLTAASWHTSYATGWRPSGQPRPGTTLDFPGLGVSRSAVVISLLVLPASTAGIRVIDKATVVAGAPLTSWTDIDQPKDASGTPVGMLQPALMPSGADTMFLVAATTVGRGQSAEGSEEEDAPLAAPSPTAATGQPGGRRCAISVAALTGLPAAPSLTVRDVPSTVQCGPIADAQQPGGARALEPGAFALSSTPVVRNGQLWFAHGIGHDYGGGEVDGVHWGAIDVGAWPRKADMVDESVLGQAGVFSFCPALMVSLAGQVVVAYARSGPSELPSVYVATRELAAPRGSMGEPVLVKAGAAAENLPPNRRNRYGDYFAAALDPQDGTVWILGEYGQAKNEAGVWLGHVV